MGSKGVRRPAWPVHLEHHHTRQQAIISSSLIAIPTFMLGGFAHPIHNVPITVQYFTYLNPLRYLIEIVRGISLKGTASKPSGRS